MINLPSKPDVVAVLSSILLEKIEVLDQEIDSSKESRDSETKSSAGDKFETSREMIQQDIARFENQKALLLQQLAALMSYPIDKAYSSVQNGSLLALAGQLFFVGVSLGKVPLKEGFLFAISIQSPLGSVLKGKKEGEEVPFRGKAEKIAWLK